MTISRKKLFLIVLPVAVSVIVGGICVWSPRLREMAATGFASISERFVRRPFPERVTETVLPDSDHADHDHSNDDHESIVLSAQALKNLGLTREFVRPVKPVSLFRTISVPAVIVERPGRSVIQVAAPMTGIVTDIIPVQGAATSSGAPLFRIRLTHEELVVTQTEFVRTLGELDVEEREMKRLREGVESGVLPPRTVLERQYAMEKLEAVLGAQREALRLHGLSDRQVQQIEKDRRLLSALTVTAPCLNGTYSELQWSSSAEPDGGSVSGSHGPAAADTAADSSETVSRSSAEKSSSDGPVDVSPTESSPTPLVIESISVHRGQSIEQGGTLCSLTDYSHLYIEGRAFESDGDAIINAMSRGWGADAVFSDGTRISRLPVSFVANEIHEESRTLRFYLDLENSIRHDQRDADGNRFVTWRFRPGQRLQLQIPVEEWTDQIVLPAAAVVQDGAESFVFVRDGSHFDRVSVHVLHRDPSQVVIANDGTITPGRRVAMRSAHQLLLAMRNQSGEVDPHAGHSH